MIYLDTHVVVWLFADEIGRFSKKARKLINENEACVSTIIRLELQYLFEIDRIIAANAALNSNLLLTKDKNILKNYEHAAW